MHLASVTMVGQFPHGIDLHVRNLRWALAPGHPVYVVASAATFAEVEPPAYPGVTYIPLTPKEIRAHGFLNFWREFPELRRQHGIDPQWFLFMEQDIWFYARPGVPDERRTIRSFLPERDYHNLMAGDTLLHHRVWEGAQLVHGSLVRNAEAFGIDFSFVPETFVDRARARYEQAAGGTLSLTDFRRPDTMDEFGLYCALIEKTRVEFDVRASHLRGPEVMHRLCPALYRGGTRAELAEAQQKLPYLDVLVAVSMYYLAGLWDSVDHLDWSEMMPGSRRELAPFFTAGREWMTAAELDRLAHLGHLIGS